MKMLHIRERRRSLVPTIIEGETGVGKTKLLTVYAAVEALSFSNNFNSIRVVRLALDSVLSKATAVPLKRFYATKIEKELKVHEEALHRTLRACVQAVIETRQHEPALLPRLLTALRGVFEGPLLCHPLYNPPQLLFFMKTMLTDPGTTEEAERAGVAAGGMTTTDYRRFNDKPLAVASKQLLDLWAQATDPKIVAHFSVFDQSEEDITLAVADFGNAVMAKLLEPIEPAAPGDDLADEVFVLPALHAFARWCLAWLLVRPVPVFNAILMHAAYTVDDLRRELAPVIRSASRATSAFSPAGNQRAVDAAVARGCAKGRMLFVCIDSGCV